MQFKALVLTSLVATSLAAQIIPPLPEQQAFTLKNAITGTASQDIKKAVQFVGQVLVTIGPAETQLMVKADANGLALAQFLVGALDVTQATAITTPEFSYTVYDGPYNPRKPQVARAFHMSHAQSATDLVFAITILHTVGKLQYCAAVNATAMIAVSGSDSDVGLAGWLLEAIDQPATGSPGAFSAEYAIPGDSASTGNILHAFYPTSSTTRPQLTQTVKLIRSAIPGAGVFEFPSPPAIIVLGTSDQIANAGEIIQQDLGTSSH